MALPRRQRGWLGHVVILLALVIVALVARTALKQYGLLDEPGKRSQPPRPAHRKPSRPPTVTPRNALEALAGRQDMVKQGAMEQQKNIDDAIPK